LAFYLGASVGPVLLSAVLAVRAAAQQAINPLYRGTAAPYSDAFLLANLPLLVALGLMLLLIKRERGGPSVPHEQ
jgi:hypothetical protein